MHSCPYNIWNFEQNIINKLELFLFIFIWNYSNNVFYLGKERDILVWGFNVILYLMKVQRTLKVWFYRILNKHINCEWVIFDYLKP